MPIKQLNRRKLLPRIGKIRLGVREKGKGGKKGYPVATPWFVVPDNVAQSLGTKEPTELHIVFPDADPEKYAPYYYQAWSYTHGLVCKGDGETATRLVDVKKTVNSETGELPDKNDQQFWPIANKNTKRADAQRFEVSCPADDCPLYMAKTCRAVMNLQFIMPDVPGLGCYQLDTGSWNTMRNVLDQIDFLKETLGRIEGIPLTLRRVIKKVRPKDQDKPKDVYILELTSEITWQEALQVARSEHTLLLPAPDDARPDDLFPDDEVMDSPDTIEGTGQVVEPPGGTEATPPEAEATPPDGDGTPQDEEGTSQDEEGTPPADGSAPPDEGDTPPEEAQAPLKAPPTDEEAARMMEDMAETEGRTKDPAKADEAPETAQEPPNPLNNTGDLMKAAAQRLGINVAKACEALGVEKPADIDKKQLPVAWGILVARFGPEKTP